MNRLLVFAVAIALAMQGFAQTVGVQSVVREISQTGQINTQKIISVNQDTVIILSQTTNGEFEFYLVGENASNVDVAEIPANFEVKDLKVLGGLIYFCGQVTQNNQVNGFVARARIADLFKYSNFKWDTIQNSKSIDKIEVYYYESQFVYIVGIGVDNNGKSLFVHCDEYANWNYYIYQSPYADEIFDDIILKDTVVMYPITNLKYVITVGRRNNEKDIVVRTYYKYNISNTSEHVYHLFANNDELAPYPLHADSLHYKWIAIAGIIEDVSGNDEKTTAFFVDIAATPSFYMYQTQSFGSYNKGDADIRDIMYSEIDTTLLIVENIPMTSFISPVNSISVVDARPYLIPPPSQVDVFYSDINGDNYPFNSITELLPYQFITAGINPNNQQINIWRGDRSNLNGNCNYLTSEGVNVRTTELFYDIYPVSGQYIDKLVWRTEPITNISSPININCQ
ncbi:MAG: hypothetical protein LBO06_01795 [Bacteroidales bacterium]|jgi:hypothetical protein|nr:hypothetical protein [Bacteroidales bacterium]